MQQTKPFAKIGDAVAANDWRFQLRAEDIPRRPPKGGAPLPPSSLLAESQLGPDRGFIEQPEERVIQTTIMPPRPKPTPPPPPPPPSQTLVMLPRRRVVTVGEPSSSELLPPPPEPGPLPPPPPALEVVEMAKKQQREPASIETRERAVQMVKEDGQPGAQARVARHFGVSQAAVSYWLSHPLPKKRGRQAGYNKPQQTMFSPPSSNGPPSGPVSVGADTLPALPTVQLTGLEEYIRALVKVEVRNELRRRLND